MFEIEQKQYNVKIRNTNCSGGSVQCLWQTCAVCSHGIQVKTGERLVLWNCRQKNLWNFRNYLQQQIKNVMIYLDLEGCEN